MSNRGIAIVAAALTAFVLVVAGGIAGRLSKRDPQAERRAATTVATMERKPAPRVQVRPAVQRWYDDDDDRAPARGGRIEREAEHDDD